MRYAAAVVILLSVNHRFRLRRVTRAHRKSRRPAGEMQVASADNNWRMISRFSSVCCRTAPG
jgi:hypothetical protein